MRLGVVLVFSILQIVMQGCAIWSVSVTLTAPENDFPISFSEGILGHDNALVLHDGYEVVHHFTLEKTNTTWNFLHFLIGNPRFDLSADFEELVQEHDGEAIVNLTIKAKEESNVIYYLSGLLTLGLIAPLSVTTTIEGDVIRLKTTIASAVIPSTQNRHLSY